MKTICKLLLACVKAGSAGPVFALFLLFLAAALAHGSELPGQHSAWDSAAAAPPGSTARALAALTAVTHGNGIWVGVSSTTIVTSHDGLEWQALSQVSSRKPQGVAFESGLFVVVGRDGLILTSTTGLDWTRRESPVRQRLLAVTADPDGFIAVGAGGTIIGSHDGIEWTKRAAVVGDELRDVCFGHGRFIAAGSRQTILISEDGHGWERAGSGSSVSLKAVAAGPNGFVAAGCGVILTSSDGRRWERSMLERRENSILGVVWGRDRWVAVGKNGLVLTSGDGRHWVESERVTAAHLHDVSFAQDHFIAVGTRGIVLRSRDGFHWEQVPERVVAAGAGEGVRGAHWPQFRGPNGSGVAPDDRAGPVRFGPEKNVSWRTQLPPGHSSPCIWGDRIFLTAFIAEREGLETLCLDRKTGEILWRKTAPKVELDSAGRVDAYNAQDGTAQWWMAGLTFGAIGVAVAGDGLLFASASGTGTRQEPIPLPGWQELLERFDRDGDGRLSEAEVPEDAEVQLRAEVPRETPGNLLSYRQIFFGMFDADGDGYFTREEWDELQAFLRNNRDNVLAIRPGGQGNISSSLLQWRGARGISEMPSPLFYRERLYFVRNGGMLTSYNPEDGTVVIDRERLGALGQYVASPVAGGGHIYAASHAGRVVVIRAGDALEVLAVNDLGEEITATPALLDGRLYVRTEKHLYAFGEAAVQEDRRESGTAAPVNGELKLVNPFYDPRPITEAAAAE